MSRLLLVATVGAVLALPPGASAQDFANVLSAVTLSFTQDGSQGRAVLVEDEPDDLPPACRF